MIDSHNYTVRLTGTGAKTGSLSSPDELPELAVASPPEFGGPAGVWSPEHLFVASVSSCLMTTFHAIAGIAGLDVIEYRDDASGHLVREQGLFRIESVTLRPTVLVNPASADKALRLLEKAESVCLISRSISAQVFLEPTVEVAAA